MASVKLYNQEGNQIGELQLEASLFGVEVRPELVHEAVVTQEANSREPIAHTKTRGEVQGSGKKPWKQKGTGRARHGSRRSPIWVGGGITFGPRNIRNFAQKMNRKARRKALAMALSDKVSNQKFVAIDTLSFDEPKTKMLADVLGRLPSSGKKTLIVTEQDNKNVPKAAQNLALVDTLPANSLNIVDVLRFDFIVATKGAIEMMTAMYKRAE